MNDSPPTDDARMFSPSCERNREPILSVLRTVLPDEGLVLEIGSGTGQHAAYFASELANIEWQPTDRGPSHDSIRAWRDAVDVSNVNDPIAFDLFDDDPPVPRADAIVCINTIHIAPWPATRRLFEHAATVLGPDAPLFLYGPFRYRDRPLEPSNEKFDHWLKERDSESGIRTFEEVDAIANELGFTPGGDEAMPANNRSIWWVRG